MTQSNDIIKVAAVFVVGLILSLGLLAMTMESVTPVLSQCHVTTEC